MSFNWFDYHRVAVELKSGNLRNPTLQDAYLRSCVSRAYYSAYHIALDFAKSKFNFSPSKDRSVHKQLQVVFKNNNLLDLSDDLFNLQRLRNFCDYDDYVQKIQIKSESAIKISSRINNEIDQLSKS